MRSGERVGVQMPTGPIEVVTRYGKLTLKPETVAAVLLQTEEHGVHEIHLTDGSKFAGLLGAEQFEMKLEAPGTGGPEQKVKFPASSIRRIQLTGKVAEPDDSTADARPDQRRRARRHARRQAQAGHRVRHDRGQRERRSSR